MQDLLDQARNLNLSPETLLLFGVGLGVLVVFMGLSAAFAGPSARIRRMSAVNPAQTYGADFDLIRGDDNDPRGLLRAFVPSSRRERTKIGMMLRQAGHQGKHAVTTFYTVRTVLGLVLPMVFVGLMALPPETQAILRVEGFYASLNWITVLQIVTGLMVAGFYGPWLWLRSRIRQRRLAIKNSFPNALDLLQVAIEAGLGFDAAMIRVSHELGDVAPEIAQEFMMLQLEIQAGKERQAAFMDMAERTGLEEMNAFANVILQANQFGTSVSSALHTFANDMRLDRELRAQEKANRLPVQMSGVMAICMMPVLLMICLTPMLIRWITMFG